MTTGEAIPIANLSLNQGSGRASNVVVLPHTSTIRSSAHREAGTSQGTWNLSVSDTTNIDMESGQPIRIRQDDWSGGYTIPKFNIPVLSDKFIPEHDIYILNEDFLSNSGVVKTLPISGELVRIKKHLQLWLAEEVEAYTELQPLNEHSKWLFRFFFKKSQRKAHCRIVKYAKYGETYEERVQELLLRVSRKLELPIVSLKLGSADSAKK